MVGLKALRFPTGNLTCKNKDYARVTQCDVVKKYRSLEGTQCFHLHGSNVITLKAEMEPPPETFLVFYKTTRCHIPRRPLSLCSVPWECEASLCNTKMDAVCRFERQAPERVVSERHTMYLCWLLLWTLSDCTSVSAVTILVLWSQFVRALFAYFNCRLAVCINREFPL